MNAKQKYYSCDLTLSRQASALLWWLPIVGILIGFALHAPASEALWAAGFAVMGVSCLVNARNCRRVHCYFTGPWFLIIAVVSLLYAVGLISVQAFNPNIIAAIGLVAGWGLEVGTEKVWGEYWPENATGMNKSNTQ